MQGGSDGVFKNPLELQTTNYIAESAGLKAAGGEHNAGRMIGEVASNAAMYYLGGKAIQYGLKGVQAIGKVGSGLVRTMSASAKLEPTVASKGISQAGFKAAQKSAASGTPATSSIAGIRLNNKLKALQGSEKGAAKIKQLPDNRIRYYDPEQLAHKTGPTRGGNYVLEYNQKNGHVRTWYDCYDHNGKVVRVHPKMINGEIIESTHYPPTGRELRSIKELQGAVN